MSWCDDPWEHEKEGREAARFGRRYDYDHNEHMREANWDRDSCDAAYARGYEREIERREEIRREEEEEERRHHERLAEIRRDEEEEYLSDSFYRPASDSFREAE